MVTKTIFLKVKIKSLAAESRIIREETRRCKDAQYKNLLAAHRMHSVRIESRATLIAYGYLRGKSYDQIEPNAKKPVPYERIKKMIIRYGTNEQATAFDVDFLKHKLTV